jgi:hypothetical protein
MTANELEGYGILASDGEIGHITEFYFDDVTWKIKYVVADVRGWLSHHKILIDPKMLGYPKWARGIVPAFLTRKQIEHSLEADADRPVAAQKRGQEPVHYGWQVYLGAEALMGTENEAQFLPVKRTNSSGKPFDQHLRATGEISGYRIKFAGGESGEVEDFDLNFINWRIARLNVLTAKGEGISVPTDTIERISLEEETVYCRLHSSSMAHRQVSSHRRG